MINDCPESVEHNFVVYEGDSITVGIHAFSLDLATYGLLVGATDADADAISAKVVLDPHHVLPAGLTINPDGSFIYIHDGTEPTLYGDISTSPCTIGSSNFLPMNLFTLKTVFSGLVTD